MIDFENARANKTKPQGFTSAPKSGRPAVKMTTKAELCQILNVSIEHFEAQCKVWSVAIDENYVPAQVAAMREHFGVPAANQPQAQPRHTVASDAIPIARTNALAIAATSHNAMSALQNAGLGNAAAYVQRKTMERNAVVDKVSDAIAYLSDPDVLEADIMSAAAAKVAARSDAWGYAETQVDFDMLFALPATSHRLLSEA